MPLTPRRMFHPFEPGQSEETDMQTIQKTAPVEGATPTPFKRHDDYEGLMFGISEPDREVIRKVAIEARLNGVDHLDALKVAIATIRAVR